MVSLANPELAELLARIEAHQFHSEGATQTFKDRLMHEQGWPADFATRAIEEYRRFAFIGAAGGHHVAPSDVVDQVWHLHLLYTQNYWDKFCKDVLRRPLHHVPATGESGEREHLGDSYAATLMSYRRLFGEPPTDIWPSPKELERRKKPRTRVVDLERDVVLSRRAIVSLAVVSMSVLIVLLILLMFWSQ